MSEHIINKASNYSTGTRADCLQVQIKSNVRAHIYNYYIFLSNLNMYRLLYIPSKMQCIAIKKEINIKCYWNIILQSLLWEIYWIGGKYQCMLVFYGRWRTYTPPQHHRFALENTSIFTLICEPQCTYIHVCKSNSYQTWKMHHHNNVLI